MGLMHGDPIVWNSEAAQYQNASYADPSGSPVGIGVGSDIGSQVFHHPLVDKTIRRTDDGKVATIIAASKYRTGSDNESFPGVVCTLLFDQGLPTEQLGHLVFSGQGAGNSHATLKVSDSPDGSWLAKSQDGLVSSPGSAGQDFDFAPATELSSHSQTFGLKAPYLFRQKQGAVAGYALTCQDSHGTAIWSPGGGGGGSAPWWGPADDGLLAANGDPATAVIAVGGVDSGQISLSRLPVRSTISVTDIVGLYVPNTTVGSGTVFLGIFDSSGTLVCQTADFSAALAAADSSGISPVSVALTGGPFSLTPDMYLVGELPVYANLLFGQPGFWGWAQNAGSSFDITGNAATTRAGLYGAAGTYTVLPGSITPASITVPPDGGSDSAFMSWWGLK